MATVYKIKIKTVSAFIDIDPIEIKTLLTKSLENYKHSTGFKLESTEVEVIKQN